MTSKNDSAHGVAPKTGGGFTRPCCSPCPPTKLAKPVSLCTCSRPGEPVSCVKPILVPARCALCKPLWGPLRPILQNFRIIFFLSMGSGGEKSKQALPQVCLGWEVIRQSEVKNWTKIGPKIDHPPGPKGLQFREKYPGLMHKMLANGNLPFFLSQTGICCVHSQLHKPSVLRNVYVVQSVKQDGNHP